MRKAQDSCSIDHFISRYKKFEYDRWLAKDIGLDPDTAHSSYSLCFSKISQEWLKLATKKFVLFQASTKSFSSCRSYISAIMRFSNFLDSYGALLASDITRSVVVSFYRYLLDKKFKVVTRRTTIVHLRTFHQIALQEGWLPWPNQPLIYSSDIPKDIENYPRYIPNDVIIQLKKSLPLVKPYIRNFITILLETGRRISEVCTLPQDCLEEDNSGDFLLQVRERKMKKIRLIPISSACLQAIQLQRKLLISEKNNTVYLFPSKGSKLSGHISARYINQVLNEIAHDYKIVDNNENIWKFHSHQFRHTIGTSMINNGVPQVIVQEYLGHETPEMTARYAHIHNETLKKAFVQYQQKMVDIRGKTRPGSSKMEAMWLKANMKSQALPNGFCDLPLSQKKCPHANACLTCGHFMTSKQFLPQHKSQLKEAKKLVSTAAKNGWERVNEMNTEVVSNLEKIIETLEKQK